MSPPEADVVEVVVVAKRDGAIGVHFVAPDPRQHPNRSTVELQHGLFSLTIDAHWWTTVGLVRTPLVVKGDEAIDLALELSDRVDLGLTDQPLL